MALAPIYTRYKENMASGNVYSTMIFDFKPKHDFKYIMMKLMMYGVTEFSKASSYTEGYAAVVRVASALRFAEDMIASGGLQEEGEEFFETTRTFRLPNGVVFTIRSLRLDEDGLKKVMYPASEGGAAGNAEVIEID